MIKRLLIANRGEIACRIIKTAKHLDIVTIALYTDVDNQSLFVQQADEAFHIDNYLHIESIIQVAQLAKVDAIHPGYGFLAENAAFAKACEKAGIIFVGPKSQHIYEMGLKDKAKAIAKQYGCPVLPEYDSDNLSFPLLIKPIAGGGGKGMEIVISQGEFAQKLASSQRVATASFANDAVIFEKYLQHPRHIEIQVLADKHGHAVYLFERDCSFQRRYQKIIEQAPALGISHELRTQMGEAAIRIIKGIGYIGAGTIEFLLDNDESFYFMEMNTRLQVEHCVTEEITGLDLVEWQLRIAQNEHLLLQQSNLQINGVAIEARLYAEDVADGFLPSTGRISYLSWPDDARIESGIQVGDDITISYDPLLAKIIVHGENHQHAWQKLSFALEKTRIAGVKTNLNFLRSIAANPQLTSATIDTHYIDNHATELCLTSSLDDLDCILLAMAIVLHQMSGDKISPWDTPIPFRLNAKASQKIIFFYKNDSYETIVNYDKSGYEIYYNHQMYVIHHAQFKDCHLMVEIDLQEYHRDIIFQKNQIWVLSDQYDRVFTLPESHRKTAEFKNDNHLLSPMPGKIIQVLVKEGDAVIADQPLLTIEAMKMEHTLRAPHAGIIKTVYFQVGDNVQEGNTVMEILAD